MDPSAAARRELQALEEKNRLLSSWLADRAQIVEAMVQLAAGWPTAWTSSPTEELHLTSLHVSSQEVRVSAQALSPQALTRLGPFPGSFSGLDPSARTSTSTTDSAVPPHRSLLGAPEVLEIHSTSHTAPADAPRTRFEVSMRFPWRPIPESARGVNPSGPPPQASAAIAASHAPRLEALQNEGARLEAAFVPQEGMPALVADLQLGAMQAGLAIQSLKPGAVETKGPWARCPVALRASGDLSSAIKFLAAAAHRPGVLAITPVSLVRKASPSEHSTVPSQAPWTLEATVVRGWRVSTPSSQEVSTPWRMGRTDLAWVFQALHLDFPDAAKAPTLAPAVSFSSSSSSSSSSPSSAFDADLQDLQAAVANAQLAWVGAIDTRDETSALLRVKGRVMAVRVGDRVGDWPWRLTRASVSGVDMVWTGAEGMRITQKAQWHLGAEGLRSSSISRGAP